MKVIVGSSLRLVGAPPNVIDRMRAVLTFDNPDYRNRTARGLPTWGVPKKIKLYEEDGAVVPRGALPLVREAARLAKRPITWESCVTKHKSVDPGEPMDGLRAYQREAVERLVQAVQGYVVIPCGGGKTFIGSAAIESTGESACVVGPTKDIVDQWFNTLAQHGMNPVKPGFVKRPMRPGDVAVGTPQSFHRSTGGERALESCGVIVFDECHRVAAPSWKSLTERCPARYRFGLTATPSRSDGLEFMIDYLIGPRVHTVTPDELVDDGFLVRPDIVVVESSWSHKTPPDFGEEGNQHWTWDGDRFRFQWVRAVSAAAHSHARNGVILNLGLAAAKDQRSTLILVPRVNGAYKIRDLLRRHGVNVEAVSGQSGVGERRGKIADLRSGELQVLVATQLADEGLDVPALDCLINAIPGKADRGTLQRVGRLMRPSGRPPILFDLADGGVVFAKHARTRMSAYRKALNASPVGPVPLNKALEMFPGQELSRVAVTL